MTKPVITINTLSESVWNRFNHPIPNLMVAKNCMTIGQAIKLKDSELMSMRNFGTKSLAYINEVRNFVKNFETLADNFPLNTVDFIDKYTR